MELGYVKVKRDFYMSVSMMITLKYVYTGILLVTKYYQLFIVEICYGCIHEKLIINWFSVHLSLSTTISI